MTATTTRQAPTKTEIRAAIAEQWLLSYSGSSCSDPGAELRGVIARMADPMVDSAARTLEAGGASAWEDLRQNVGPSALWEDLRPTQAVRLMDLVEEATDRAEARCTVAIEEELAAAALAFAAEYPDAPRAVR